MIASMLTLVLALQPATPVQPPPAAPPQTTVVQPQAPVARPDEPDTRRRSPSGPNVRVDVTLSEAGGTGAAASKTVTVTTSDNTSGKLRTQVTSRAYGAAPLNVDVFPRVQPNGSVLLTLTIEYSQGRNPDVEGNPDRIMNVSLNQSASLLLESGKPLTLSQSADPIGDRKVTVEVKATVLKN
jgi:hypothetical protein